LSFLKIDNGSIPLFGWSHSSVPAYATAAPPRTGAVKEWPLLERPPAGLVLDGCEHGGIIVAAGAKQP